MDNYKLLGKIGKGAHGLVFKALNLKDNDIVALKQITVVNASSTSGLPKNIMREISVLRSLHSPNIVQLVDISNLDSAVLVVMEYLPYNLGELLQRLEEPFPLPRVKMYMKMILLGVKTMHDHNIMHRDLKPANLLISKEGVLKIADFGLSRIFKADKDATYTHQVGTRWYRAPELLYGAQKYTQAVDLWAIGCILGEMIDKQPIFPGESDIGQLAVVLATLGTPNEDIWPDLKSLPDYKKIVFTPSEGISWDSKFPEADSATVDLISKFLQYNHLSRISVGEALNHHFFFRRPLPWVLPRDSARMKLEDESVWHLKDFDEIIKVQV